MKKLILIAMCAFLYVMPVNATELSEPATSEVAPVEEVVEEGTDTVTEEVVESLEEQPQESAPQESGQEQETPFESASTPETEEAGAEAESTVEETVTEETVTEETVEETVEETTELETTVSEEVTIPDVVGMTEAEAAAALEAIVLSDGSAIEVIKEYKYTNEAEKDIVFEQTPSGTVSEEEAKQVTIVISMGKDPKETVVDGITEPLNQTISSAYGINWDSIPEYYDYNWDNSQNCWVNGVWIDGVKYLTPEGSYNTNVRHKIQLYTDGTYVYTHIVLSRDYQAAANGNWFQYFIDGQMAAFQVEDYNGTQLANNNLAPGTYQVVVRHADGSGSYNEAYDSSAYYTVFDSQVNAHLEIKIPLSEMAVQNSNIDSDNAGTIEFFTPNLMSSKIAASGASTFPFATAAAALVLVPGTALVINKKRKVTKKESNE